jgi:hypothetical protein
MKAMNPRYVLGGIACSMRYQHELQLVHTYYYVLAGLLVWVLPPLVNKKNKNQFNRGVLLLYHSSYSSNESPNCWLLESCL